MAPEPPAAPTGEEPTASEGAATAPAAREGAAAGPPASSSARTWPALLACAALLLAGAGGAGRTLLGKWFDPDGYYGHAPLLLAALGWLLARERQRLVGLPRGSSLAGFPLVALALWLGLVGWLEQIAALQHQGLALGLVGSLLVLRGGAALRATWPLLLYAWLALVPLPTLALDALTGRLRLLAARLAFAALELLELPAVLQGGAIHLGQGRVVLVDEACSGLRSLISLLALAGLLALLQPRRARALAALGVALPAALLANAARVGVLTGFALSGHPLAPEGWAHSATGLVTFAVAMALLLAVAPPDAERSLLPSPGRAGVGRGPGPARRWALYLTLGLGGVLVTWQGTRSAAPGVPQAVAPLQLSLRLGPWRGRDVELPAAHQAMLGAVAWRYLRFERGRDEPPVDVLLVHAARAGDLHAPELCWTLQGFVERDRERTALATSIGPLPAARVHLEGLGERALAYTAWRLEARWVADLSQARWLGLRRRLSSLAPGGDSCVLRLSTPARGGAEPRLEDFAREALGPLLQALPPP